MNTSSIASASSPGNQTGDAKILQGATVEEEPLVYDVPKPRTAFSSFVDHPDEFITFLEACLKEESMKQEDKIDLYTTLFEMYLHNANSKTAGDRDAWEAKAKMLIEDKDVRFILSNYSSR
jgi:hypothetical protein